MSTAKRLLKDKDARAAIVGALCGERLGAGCFRSVYAAPLLDGLDTRGHRWVIKVQLPPGTDGAEWHGTASFPNAVEWNVWAHVRETPMEKYFAPIKYASTCGRILVQRRTRQLGGSWPDPAIEEQVRALGIFSDIKPDNFGWLDNRIVCHDYALHSLMDAHLQRRGKKRFASPITLQGHRPHDADAPAQRRHRRAPVRSGNRGPEAPAG